MGSPGRLPGGDRLCIESCRRGELSQERRGGREALRVFVGIWGGGG